MGDAICSVVQQVLAVVGVILGKAAVCKKKNPSKFTLLTEVAYHFPLYF